MPAAVPGAVEEVEEVRAHLLVYGVEAGVVGKGASSASSDGTGMVVSGEVAVVALGIELRALEL